MAALTFDDVAAAAPAQKPPSGALTFDDVSPAASSAPAMTKLERFGTGLADPVHGAAQLAYHALPDVVTRNVDALNNWLAGQGVPLASVPPGGLDAAEKQREAAVQQQTPAGTDWYRLAGNVASPLNYIPGAATGKVATGAERIGQSLLAGAAGGAMQPVTEGDFASEKAKQMAGGAAVGGVLGGAAEAAGRALAPKFAPDVQALLDLGVELTPGQMAGGAGKRAEDALSSVPVLGSFIKSGQARSVESFNRAALNLALDPIGKKIPKTVDIGREGIEHAENEIKKAYDDLLPKMVFKADPVFQNDLNNLRTLVQELPPEQANQFERVFANRVEKRLDPNGVMLGDTLKQVESELSNISRSYKSSSDAAQRQYGTAIDELRNLLRQNLQRSNPEQAEELGKINSAYARFVRVQEASTRRPSSNGVFTPNDLASVVRKTDDRVRKGRFARGSALMQNLSDPATAILPQKVPDSGTAGRLMAAGGVGALLNALGTGAVNPAEVAAAIGALGATAPYTEPGMAVLQQWAKAAPAAFGSARESLETAAPYFSAPATAAAIGATRSGGEQ